MAVRFSIKGRMAETQMYFGQMVKDPRAIPSFPITRMEIYTDGSCDGNYTDRTSKGGWAYYIRAYSADYQGEFPAWAYADCGCVLHTTNNEMELMAICMGMTKAYEILQRLPGSSTEGLRITTPIEILSDSQYAIGVSVWANNWIRNDWHTRTGGKVQNLQLIWWLLYLNTKFIHRKRTHVQGHNGVIFNEICDQLAKGTYGYNYEWSLYNQNPYIAKDIQVMYHEYINNGGPGYRPTFMTRKAAKNLTPEEIYRCANGIIRDESTHDHVSRPQTKVRTDDGYQELHCPPRSELHKYPNLNEIVKLSDRLRELDLPFDDPAKIEAIVSWMGRKAMYDRKHGVSQGGAIAS